MKLPETSRPLGLLKPFHSRVCGATNRARLGELLFIMGMSVAPQIGARLGELLLFIMGKFVAPQIGARLGELLLFIMGGCFHVVALQKLNSSKAPCLLSLLLSAITLTPHS